LFSSVFVLLTQLLCVALQLRLDELALELEASALTLTEQVCLLYFS
jgi:hypothetical protein